LLQHAVTNLIDDRNEQPPEFGNRVCVLALALR
jgi:hypothetical protein